MRTEKKQTKKLSFEKFEVARISTSNKVLGGSNNNNGGGHTPQSSIKCLKTK